MALMESARDRTGRGPHVVSGASATRKQQSALRSMALELVGTFFVLIGIAVGVLTLRVALVLMRGVLL
jgi:hypothetical protein